MKKSVLVPLCLMLAGCGGGVYPDECRRTVTYQYPPIYLPFQPPFQHPPITITLPDDYIPDYCKD